MIVACPSSRFYKTGDFVVVDPDGTVHFLGRVDRQVKVNGYRVELEHIESVLRRIDGVRDAAVFQLELNGRPRLVAAITGVHDQPPTTETLRERLAALLPEYMIPSLTIALPEFPRNENGKSNLRAIEALVAQSHAASMGDGGLTQCANGSPLAEELRALWRKQLRHAQFGDDESFFTLGGDSLDAIQVISELQVRGHDVTARAFLDHPTIRGLLGAIQNAPHLRARSDQPEPTHPRLTPAQDFFLRQQLAAPDHYNQALLLACEERIDEHALGEALTALTLVHPQLRTRYQQGQPSVGVARKVTASLSMLASALDQHGKQLEIDRIANLVHRSISLPRGELFRAHLFRETGGDDHLLLVAHHLAVDVISWRILIGDLIRAYSDARLGKTPKLAPSRTSVHRWTTHLLDNERGLADAAGRWLVEAQAHAGRTEAVDPRNTEGASRTIWIGLSRAQTSQLLEHAHQAAPLQAAVLGQFAVCHARERGVSELWVDVESHGRLTLDAQIDISRAVSWHTSTYPVRLRLEDDSPRAAAGEAQRALECIPHLGVAFGLAELRAGRRPARTACAVVYNFLGDIQLAHDDRLGLRNSPYAPGRGRGDENDRHHQLKLSARISEGQLVLDLSIPGHFEVGRYTLLMREVRDALLALVGAPAEPGAQVLLEDGSRTGLLSYVPPALVERAVAGAKRSYRRVLLTGATGFIGAHVLRELLEQSDARVTCLVRAKNGGGAEQRLRACYAAYFDHPLEAHAPRIEVVEGELGEERFGLEAPAYQELSCEIDAIYHLAADTRLFGAAEAFARSNVIAIEQLLCFAQQGREKDLHYMSTLAVSGVIPGPEAVDFDEDSLDIGQEFQNEYEASKYRAEQLVRAAHALGRRAFIYRSGNVSGRSRDGRFQLNAGDNRFVQFLIACARLGRLPRELGEPVVLSPVDDVAAGMVAISLDATCRGGVHHLDGSHAISMDGVFHALEAQGVRFQRSSHANFASLFAEVRTERDRQIALGQFWSGRKPRNVRYVNDRTQRHLARLGRGFKQPDDAWLSSFIRRLVAEGLFAQRETTEQRDDSYPDSEHTP